MASKLDRVLICSYDCARVNAKWFTHDSDGGAGASGAGAIGVSGFGTETDEDANAFGDVGMNGNVSHI